VTTTTGPADHYAVLGVPRDATSEAIRAAYRDRMRTAHPDAGGSLELAQALNEAHRVLTDRVERARYDAVLPDGAGGPRRPTPAWGTGRPVQFRTAGPAEHPAPPAPGSRDQDVPGAPETPPAPDPPRPAPTTRRVLVLPEPTVVTPPSFRLAGWATVVLGALGVSALGVGLVGVGDGAPAAGWATLGLLVASVVTGRWTLRSPGTPARVVALLTWAACGIAVTAVVDRTTGVPLPAMLLALVVSGALSPARAERTRVQTEAARATAASTRLRRAALEWDAVLATAAALRTVPRWVEHAVADDDGSATRARLRSARGRAAQHVLHGLWPSGIWVVMDRTGTVHGWATEEARRTWERFAPEVAA
jgi:hypothetical protein